MSNLSNYEIGAIGEKIVHDFFLAHGHSVVKSLDKFDQEKDLVVNGVNVEVKTQTLYRGFQFPHGRKPAFTIPILGDTKLHRNQLSKCMNVERLIFVQRPTSSDPVIRLYEADHPGKRSFTITQNIKDGRYIAGFDVDILHKMVDIKDQAYVTQLMDNWRPNYVAA